jgi:BirA family biotin operon repressor/biotin-[acetyl-CoA-carboxylase] ligase
MDAPWPGAVLVQLDSTSSTMDDARELARSGCASGSVVCARSQRGGRGRVPGRTWISPPGESLLATVVVLKRDITFPVQELPLRAGVAAARAIEDASGVPVKVKWPNDLMVEDRKLAGLLCEAVGDALLVGIGVNLLQKSFPPEMASRACSLFQASGQAVSAQVLLSMFLSRLRESLRDNAWRDRLLERLGHRGRHVRVDLLGSGDTVEGTVAGVDDKGRLILRREDGREILVEQGEIASGP